MFEGIGVSQVTGVSQTQSRLIAVDSFVSNLIKNRNQPLMRAADTFAMQKKKKYCYGQIIYITLDTSSS